MTNNRFSNLLQQFLTSYIINECNYSMETKKSYSTTFHLLLKYLSDVKKININKIEIELITKDVILQFLDWLETERKVSISTRNQRLACIKSFYKYIQINQLDLFDTSSQILTIRKKKVPNKIISYFTEEEIKIMFKYLSEDKNYKFFCMMILLYETAARVTEFVNIKISDINLSENPSITLYGKRKKTRIIPINEVQVNIIQKYLKSDYIDYGSNYLFFSNTHQNYDRHTINYLINKLVGELKEEYPGYFTKKYSPHSFRHAKATHLYNNGTPLLYIKEFLGHSSVKSTEIYATPDGEKQREYLLRNASKINSKHIYKTKEKQNLDDWLKNNTK